ncbi:PIN domain-containing protein [Marivirga tractuosa]|uniref:PIN domain-containing protein n=1 Tax=Marivirga tractuosa TaxID=1006 RepID=UPI0035CED519
MYLLSGDKTIASLLNERNIYVSFVTELELLGYKDLTSEDRTKIKDLLADSTIIDINSMIKNIVIDLRKTYKIKLPDAIIAASSHFLKIPFMTSDKNLSKLKELEILMYENS